MSFIIKDLSQSNEAHIEKKVYTNGYKKHKRLNGLKGQIL